jgi:DNA-binding MarR family transcriptional regulator
VTDDTRWLDDGEQRTWRAFLAAQRLLFDRVERQLQHDAGLPQAYYEILVRLSEVPDHTLRMSQLAEHSLSSRSRLSHAVARLEAAGWVRRRACAEDRRGAFAELTPAGLAKLESAAPGHVATVRASLFDVLTPEQQAALREVSEALVAHLCDAPEPPVDDG